MRSSNTSLLLTGLMFVCLLQTIHSQPLPKKQHPTQKISYTVNPLDLKRTAKSGQHTIQVPSYRPISPLGFSRSQLIDWKVQHHDPDGLLWVQGNWKNPTKARGLDSRERHTTFTNEVLSAVQTEAVVIELETLQAQHNVTHSRFQQRYHGIPVWGNQITLHQKGEEYTMMGRLRPIGSVDMTLAVDEKKAMSITTDDLQKQEIRFVEGQREILPDDIAELVVYPQDDGMKLVWHLTRHPNPAVRREYFVSAVDGLILDTYESICHLHDHGKGIGDADGGFFNESSEGQGVDLNGDLQIMHTWWFQGNHYLIDASKSSMFNPSQSDMPYKPVGAIITLDAQNTYPGHNNFNVTDLTSSVTTWDDPIAVSAHANVGKAYDYFEQTFGRISINGQGGNVISLVNVVDERGQSMDNAFWNGKAMFFGNGNQSFSTPLARSLDVTVHELTHGVVQTTANLEYRGESGALNESFADVVAVQVDDEDWLIGEDIVNPAVFPTGALRDVSNPSNGGSSLNDRGYQPPTYDKRYTGSQDNGGVHINSGIPNHAFYLFATEVGMEKASQVYYDVLTNYLTRSSQFVDMRIAVVEASRMRYGETEAAAARSAFDAVGIVGEDGGDYVVEQDGNPGNDLIFFSDTEYSKIALATSDGNIVADPLTSDGVQYPPSVSDDGTFMVYVAGDRTLRYAEFDWNQGTYETGELEPNPVWGSVAVSRDGLRIAAVPWDVTDSIFVFSLEHGDLSIFELSNPTTATEEINTADVLFADAIEWDHSGQYLIYDAFNRISNSGSLDPISYWDISYIRVWDNHNNTYGDGYISKLFSGLPEKVSIANPTFAENSPHIIAFDLLDLSVADDAFRIMGVNVETGDVGTIYEQTVIGYPSFSLGDDRIIFDGLAQGGTPALGIVPIGSDKISPGGNATLFRESASWGVWFGNGERQLITPVIEDDLPLEAFQVFPNPVENTLYIRANELDQGVTPRIQLLSLEGKTIMHAEMSPLQRESRLPVESLPSGIYFLRLETDHGHRMYKIAKQ